MGSTRLSIHVCWTNSPVFKTNFQYIIDFFHAFDCKERQFLNIYSRIWLFVEFKLVLWIFRKQVSNLFLIDFKIACPDQKLSLLGIAFNSFENILKRPRHDSSILFIFVITSHSMRLSSSSLTIGKNSSIVSFQHVFDDMCGALVVYINLLWVPVETMIEGKLLWGLVSFWFVYEDLASFVVHFDHYFIPSFHFLWAERSTSNSAFNALGCTHLIWILN